MTDDDARALVHRWWQGIWGDGDLSILEELCTDPYIRHTSMGSERISLAEYKKRLVQTRQVLRDAVTTIDDQVVSGDKVWSRATSRGVNLSTSDRTVITWIVIHRIEDGKLAETWAATLAGVEWKTPS
jgi:predicted SnoaL-like aldol condensation-catalyzing enzyme